MKKKRNIDVILDTNFFVDMFRFKVSFDDIEDVVGSNCKFWLIEQSIRELKNMRIKEAKIALVIIDEMLSENSAYEKRVKVLKTDGRFKSADQAIISLIEQLKSGPALGLSFKRTVVATNDAKLRKKIKALDTRVIYLRARKRLEIQ